MIIARGTKDGNDVLILGVSDENVVRLVKGEPIHIRRITHGDGCPDGWEIFLVHGKTERDIVAGLKAVGVITEETNTIPCKNLGRSSDT